MYLIVRTCTQDTYIIQSVVYIGREIEWAAH